MALGRASNEGSNFSSVFSEVAGVAPLRASRDHRAGWSKRSSSKAAASEQLNLER